MVVPTNRRTRAACVHRLVMLGLALQFALRASSSIAQAPPRVAGTSWQLTQLVDTALRHNPDLVTATARVDSAHAERTIAGALPNPTLQSIPNVPFQYSVTVPLDVGPQRWYRVRTATLGASATLYDLADLKRQVTFTVRAAYFDLLLADSLRTIAREQRDAVAQVVAADSARVRAGDAPERDLARSTLELAHAEATLAQTASTSRAARVQLQLLLGIQHPDTSFALAGGLDYAPINLNGANLAAESRADLAAAQQRTLASQAAGSLARSELIPVPGIGLVVQPHGLFATGSHVAPAISPSSIYMEGNSAEPRLAWRRLRWRRRTRAHRSKATSRSRSPIFAQPKSAWNATSTAFSPTPPRRSNPFATRMAPALFHYLNFSMHSVRTPKRARTIAPPSTTIG